MLGYLLPLPVIFRIISHPFGIGFNHSGIFATIIDKAAYRIEPCIFNRRRFGGYISCNIMCKASLQLLTSMISLMMQV